MPKAKIANWQGLAGNYALWTDPAEPTAASIQAALEALPNIGAGNVKVTRTAGREYDITFQGTLAEKDVPAIATGAYYSNLPQESLDDIIKAASALSAGTGGPTTTTTLPPGLSANDYILQLILQGNIDEAGKVLSGQLLGNIDVTATLAAITGLFPAKPNLTTSTAGVDPVPEQFQDLCSQGSVTVTVAAPPVVATPPAAVSPAVAFNPAPAKGAPSTYRCSTVKRRVKVRIKGTHRYRTVTRRVRVCKKVSTARTRCSTVKKRVKVRIKGTHRYHTVTRRVRVCKRV
jgi:hypothetical protein